MKRDTERCRRYRQRRRTRSLRRRSTPALPTQVPLKAACATAAPVEPARAAVRGSLKPDDTPHSGRVRLLIVISAKQIECRYERAQTRQRSTAGRLHASGPATQ